MDDQRLQQEISKGCDQVRELENKIRQGGGQSQSLLIAEAASIIMTFTGVIQMLNRTPLTPTSTTTSSLITKQIRLNNSAPNSPALTMAAATVVSPVRITPPHSPHTSSSPALSTTPDGSPSGGAAVGGATIAPLSLEVAASVGGGGGGVAEDFGCGPRKRRCMPKRTVKISANNSENGNESPADDGFTWRKYGQKDILNTKHPRSYYRCTHQKEMGCPATKYVQKCEDDPTKFQVTYIGDHTCQQIQPPQSIWNTRVSTGFPPLATLFSRPTTTTFDLLKPSPTIASPSQWVTPKFAKVEPLLISSLAAAASASVAPSCSQPFPDPFLSLARPNSIFKNIPKDESSVETTSSLPPKVQTGTEPVDHPTMTSGEDVERPSHELWNLEDLTSGASLNNLFKPTENQPTSTYMEEFDEDQNVVFTEPMLF